MKYVLSVYIPISYENHELIWQARPVVVGGLLDIIPVAREAEDVP